MPEEIKRGSKMWIVGVNLLIMFLYSITCYSQGSDGLVLMWMIMLAHVGIGFFLGIGAAILPQYRDSALPWILSSVAILLIGLSTCYMVVSGSKGI